MNFSCAPFEDQKDCPDSVKLEDFEAKLTTSSFSGGGFPIAFSDLPVSFNVF